MSSQSFYTSRKLALATALLALASLAVSGRSDVGTSAVGDPANSLDALNETAPGIEQVSRLEFLPFRGVVIAAERGSTGEGAIEIVNNDLSPFEIAGLEHSSERFTARIETIEPGHRYRLTVTFTASGPEGKMAEPLYLISNRDRIAIPVHTAVIPRVYTFPAAVQMGKFPLSHIKGNPETARSVAQILMVYRKNTTGFEIKVSSDIPFLNIESEQGPDGDRWENTIWLDSERVQPGEIEGTIVIETNDPEFSKLEVPVTGQILDQ